MDAGRALTPFPPQGYTERNSPCPQESSFKASGSGSLLSDSGTRMRNEMGLGCATAIAVAAISCRQATSPAGGSSAAAVSDQSMVGREQGLTRSGAGCSTDAAAKTTRTGLTTAGAALRSATAGGNSPSFSKIWGTRHQAQQSSAETTTPITARPIAIGPTERRRPETQGDPSSSNTEADQNRSPLGLKSSGSITGSSIVDTNSDGRQKGYLPTFSARYGGQGGSLEQAEAAATAPTLFDMIGVASAEMVA